MRFQWLKDYQDLEEQILYLKWNLNKSKLELARWVSGDLSKVRLEKNSRASSLEENIQKVAQEIQLLENQRVEMKVLVESFKGIDNQIARMKYVEGCNLEEIAEETGYSESYIRKRHAEIRNKLDFLDEYEANSINRQNKISEIEFYNEKGNNDEQLTLF